MKTILAIYACLLTFAAFAGTSRLGEIRANDYVVTNEDDRAAIAYTTAVSNKLEIGKQKKLVSGTNIKTVNGQSLLGSGNIVIEGGGGGGGADTNAVNGLIRSYDETNLTARINYRTTTNDVNAIIASSNLCTVLDVQKMTNAIGIISETAGGTNIIYANRKYYRHEMKSGKGYGSWSSGQWMDGAEWYEYPRRWVAIPTQTEINQTWYIGITTPYYPDPSEFIEINTSGESVSGVEFVRFEGFDKDYEISFYNTISGETIDITLSYTPSEIIQQSLLATINDIPTTIAWSGVTGKPNKLSGYGINDAYTKDDINGNTVTNGGAVAAAKAYADATKAPKLTGRTYDFANGSNFTKRVYEALTNVIQTLGGTVTNTPTFTP